MFPATALLLAIVTTQLVAAADRQTTAGHTIFLSHLSPLITYTPSSPTDDPVSGWNVSQAQHSTINANASVEFMYFGSSFIIGGNYSSLDAPGRYNRDRDWYEASIKTDGSSGSFMDFSVYSISSTVPAETW